MDAAEVSTQLIAYARFEDHGPKRNLMRLAAQMLDTAAGLDAVAVVDFLESRDVKLLKWQLDRILGDSAGG